MKVGLFGFGKTGQAVAKSLLADPEVELVWVARQSASEFTSAKTSLSIESEDEALMVNLRDISPEELFRLHPVDAVIDFSAIATLHQYGQICARKRIAIVSAVSNYDENSLKALQTLSTKTPVLWSPNITLGINFLFLAAKAIKGVNPKSDVQVSEEHFREKVELSGTAIRLAKMLEKDIGSINMVRAGGIVGIHEVLFGYQHETLRLRHESITREAFGDGAIFAAKNIVKRSAGLYRMEDLLLPYFAFAEGSKTLASKDRNSKIAILFRRVLSRLKR